MAEVEVPLWVEAGATGSSLAEQANDGDVIENVRDLLQNSSYWNARRPSPVTLQDVYEVRAGWDVDEPRARHERAMQRVRLDIEPLTDGCMVGPSSRHAVRAVVVFVGAQVGV